MAKNKTAITIALVLVLAFSAVFAAVPFVNAQNYNIYISVASATGLVTVEVRIGSTRQITNFTGASFGYLAPGGSWTNVSLGDTSIGRWTYYLGTLVTNGVWHFQARVPTQANLPANPATPDGSWYSQDLTVTIALTPLDLPSFLWVNVCPNPSGKDQLAYINLIFSKPPTGTAADHYVGLTVDIVRPDGVKETLGPFKTDGTGGAWTSYTPATTGNYTLQAHFPGQNFRDQLTASIPLGKYRIVSGNYLVNQAADDSDIYTWTVTEEPVGGWQQPPLPTEYWSRPIYATNWDMGALLGSNWWGLNAPSFTDLGGYDATGNVQPYGEAPNSPHIMWTRSTTMGGQPGGTTPSDQEGQFTSTSILNRHWEPIIIYGLNVYQTWNSAGEAGSGFEKPARWIAVDIRTGETVWQRSRGITGSETLRGAWIQKFHSIQEYGSFGILFATGSAIAGVNMGYLYDPFTGEHISNVTNVDWGSAIIGTHPDDYRHAGGLYRYYVTGGNLTCWNSTRLWGASPGSGQNNWTNGVQWSFNVTATYGDGMPTGVRVLDTSTILLQAKPQIEGGAYTYYSSNYVTLGAVNARTGEKLWGPVNHTNVWPYTHDVGMYGAREGFITLWDKDTQEGYCFSAKDGSKLWGPVSIAKYTNAFDAIEMDTEVYKGVVVFWGFGGNVVGLNATTGEIMWHWTRGPADYSSPYGIYCLWDFGSESFADGKCFFSEGSMYDVPLNPSRRVAIDVYTGELVWSILSYSGRSPGPIADGYLLEWNSFSNELTCFGKGPTATSVSIENDVTTFGDEVLVKGMVTDISPGTKAYNREARFPHGVPAVSEESQRTWMEYVYMQQVRPANATGVEVVISVMDPNNNPIEVGTATSDANGMYSLSFTPEVPGKYTVYATFAGSESYWSSNAETAMKVKEAPAATPAPTPPPATMTDTYVTGFGIGMIIAIVVVGLLLFMLFRKR